MAQPSPSTQTFISDEIGEQQDAVQLELGGDKIVNATGWNIEESILAQPARWTLQLGFADVAAKMFARYNPGTEFRLRVMGQLQATGRLDSRHLEMREGQSGASLTLSGRDALAPLHDGYVKTQQHFVDSTYFNMVSRALDEVGLDSSKLVKTNTNNRKLKAGVPISETSDPNTVDTINEQPGVVGAIGHELQAKCGERWLHFLRRHLDRAGLMLWAAADGSFVLSAPNARQSPVYRIFRRLTQTSGETNIRWFSYADDVTARHTEAIVYGRGGGRKFGRTKAKGAYTDQEMVDYGYKQPIVFRDAEAQTENQAAYFARRKLAEERRAGWRLEYIVAGHTLPLYEGGTGQRAVITPDTVVSVDDELSGISDTFYIESVRRTRGPETTTWMRLMRLEDLVFGDLANTKSKGASPPPAKKPSAQPVDGSYYDDLGKFVSPQFNVRNQFPSNLQGGSGNE